MIFCILFILFLHALSFRIFKKVKDIIIQTMNYLYSSRNNETNTYFDHRAVNG